MWIEKYKPKRFDEFLGNKKVIEYLRRYNWKKPLLIYGHSGVGKSVLVELIAVEFDFDLVEITDDNLENSIASSQTFSLHGKRKLIFIDDVDMIGNIKKVTDLLKKTISPTVLTTSDYNSKRLSTIKKLCEKINIRMQTSASIAKFLERICMKEGISVDRDVLKKISDNAHGDIRSAVIDLETVAKGRKKITEEDLSIIGSRDRSTDIYKVLNSILIKRNFNEALNSTWNLDLRPNDIELWIDENLPRIYKDKKDLQKAYQYLSRADIFLGRILNRQYWGFLRYTSTLMTGGVNISKEKRIQPSYFQFPRYITKMAQSRKERNIKRSIGEKLSPELHVSSKIIIRDYIPLYRILLRKGKITDEELEGKYGFNVEELEYLRSS